MAKSAEFCKTDGPVAVNIYNEDGTIHTYFARSRYAAITLAKGLGAVDIEEVTCSKLFPNGPPSTSKSARASGSGLGQSHKSSKARRGNGR